jgi:non-ribosomal peptide synthetase component E (peptide arylation enzyme)
LLSLVHVLEWRAAVTPGVIALSDQQGAELTYAGLAAAVERSAAGIDGAAGFDTATLVSWARERLAGFKCPTGVTVVPGLPRNATGKVLRAALRQPFWTGRDRLVS